MPIDLEFETLIPIRDVSKHTPGRPHVATCYRWTQRTVNPLETVRVGGRVFSSVEAIRRFIARCSSKGAVAQTPSARRRQQVERAEQELAQAGIG